MTRGKRIAIIAGIGVVVILGWTVFLYTQRYLAVFGGVRTFSPQPTLKEKAISLMRGETEASGILQHLSNYTGLYVRVDDENPLSSFRSLADEYDERLDHSNSAQQSRDQTSHQQFRIL